MPMNRGKLRKIEVWLIDIGFFKEDDRSNTVSSTRDMWVSGSIMALMATALTLFPLYDGWFNGGVLGALGGAFFWFLASVIVFLIVYGALSHIDKKRQIRESNGSNDQDGR
jgi:hypothetical protein